MHAEFLTAFATSLHGVFLWGMAIAIIPFALSWLIKDKPLRTTLGHRAAELSAEEAAGRATPPEAARRAARAQVGRSSRPRAGSRATTCA